MNSHDYSVSQEAAGQGAHLAHTSSIKTKWRTERVRKASHDWKYGKQSLLQSIDKHVVCVVDPASYEAEQYRKLSYAIDDARNGKDCLAVGVCSPVAQDGKSLTALNLAAVLAQDNQADVLLIDADLRRQSESLKENLPFLNAESVGLSDIVMDGGRIDADDVIHTIPVLENRLDIIQAGTTPVTPYEFFKSAAFGKLIDTLKMRYTFIVFDAPPIVPVSDCRIIARHVDSFLMVVAANQTPRSMLSEALNLMKPTELLGIVFNKAEHMSSRYYGYYNYGRTRNGNRGKRRFKNILHKKHRSSTSER